VRSSSHSAVAAAITLLTLAFAACDSGGGSESQQDAAPPPVASALFVLGDSLSDVGNAAGAADYVLNLALDPPTVGLCNPADVLVAMRSCDDLFYQQSRVSDGPVAVEHLAAHLELPELRPSLHVLPAQRPSGTVYAVASAKARGPGDEDLARQVDRLLLEHALLPADAVFVVMIGGNDALDALQADVAHPAALAPPSAAIIASAVAAIGTQVERLLAYGARQLVVANVPDLAVLPAVRAAARSRGDESRQLAAASAISDAFNRELAAKLDELEARVPKVPPAPVIARFDLHAALAAAQHALTVSGGNARDACFDSELYRDSAAAQRAFHPDCAPLTADGAPRFGNFVFFDGIHPTGAAHAAIGDALRALF
jgi:phospholipase/lecithinase/hemolysin